MTEKIKRERGRPKKLTERFKRFIASSKKAHPDWSAEIIREKLFRALYDSLRENHPDWSATQISHNATVPLPGLSRIQKYLADINPFLAKPSELDQPWHFGLMSKPKYSITPDAVPFIMMVQGWLEKMPRWQHDSPLPQKPLTIRQALWISRIYRIGDESALAGRIALPDFLFLYAEAYAYIEAISTLTGTLFDTTVLDKAMREHKIPIIIVSEGEPPIGRWLDGSLAEPSFLNIKDILEKVEKINKDGEK